MSFILNTILRPQILRLTRLNKQSFRTFLSPSYYCKEAWENRLNNPILQRVDLDLLYHELDQRFQKTRQISAVDVDIFANAIKDDLFLDELLDLVHKLRLSADTGNTLESTPHAVIRTLVDSGKTEELLQALDDRLNYGLFLDDYTANILMDTFWKSKDFVSGSRVASQLMLQDFKHPVSTSFALLHCYNYLLKPGDWPLPQPPEEPEEEVKVRVKYLRNPYDDSHFDLREPSRIVGKTLAMATNGKDDSVSRSLNLVGLALYGEKEAVKQAVDYCRNKNISVFKEVLDVLPEDNEFKGELNQLKQESGNVTEMLEKQLRGDVAKTMEQDIGTQCELFRKWEEGRGEALEAQRRQLQVAKRLVDIENIRNSLKVREQKLWFFEKEEEIELGIESKQVTVSAEKKKSAKGTDEDYVPPEIKVNRTN